VSTFEHTEYGPVWITVQGDITERKQAEEALRESEERLRRVLDALPAAAYTCDTAGLITYFNQSACDLWGRAPKLNHPDDRFCGAYRLYWADGTPMPHERSFMAQAVLEGKENLGAEVIVECPDGSRRFVLAHANPLRNTDGQLVGGINVQVDITERQQMEQALRDSRARLAAIVKTALDAIITVDSRGIIDSVNPATERLFGYTAAEMIGQNVAMLMPSPYKDEHDEYVARYLQTGEKHIIGIRREVVGQCKDGRLIPMDLAVNEFHVHGRRMFIGIHHDLRPRKQLEREVLEAATAEQRAIGQALHDSTGQELTALELLVQSLAETVAKQSPAVTGLTAKVLQGLQRVHTQIRGYARGLIPVEVDGQGLTTALANLASRTDQVNQVTCTFECPEPVEIESLVVANHLYHIAQEAVGNALRHAKPRRITIQLESDDQFITLRVRDDGVGFRESVAYPGMGLKIMRYRAGLMNARLTVQRAQPTGTLVTCTLRKGAIHGQEQDDPQ
jgi:PAS domain S-box-containing protein